MAGAGDFGFGDGGGRGDYGRIHSSGKCADGGDDGIAVELDSDVFGAVVFDLAHYLHRAGAGVEGGYA